MNSTIASNINGTSATDKDSINRKLANASRSSLLISNIDFSVAEVKKPSTSSNISGKYLYKVGDSEIICNGQKKQKNCVDQNKNTYNNSYQVMNGNKEKVEDGIPVPKIQLYSGKIHLEWKQIYKIGAGLSNIGNTCFMNTVLQCLTYCPPLANYLLHDNDHSSKCTISGFCMMCLLQKHIRRTIGKTGDIIKPNDIYQRLKLIAKHFQFGRQEDAHEFLRYVIDNLWKSCLNQNNNSSKLDPASKETTVINQIFGGYHRSQVTCLRCKEKSNTFDHFMDFILDIKQNVLSLEKALEKFIQPELLEQENSYKCPKCKMKVTAQKKFTVYKAPNVATFQLKRFDYNRSFGGKITKQISYPDRLNLRPFMSDPKNSNGVWYIMDDQRVAQVSYTQVMSQTAYVLFYIKSEPSQGPSMKKCLENRSPVIKGNLLATNYKKTPEINSIKSSPLTERNQPKQSSPTIKFQISLNNTKKHPVTPNHSREPISFGMRPSMPVIQDIRKSESMSPSKKIKQSPNSSKAANNHSGLVPYVKDSSESSDENENAKLVNPKTEIKYKSPFNDSENTKLDGAKNVTKINKPFSENSPNLEIKRKMSKSILSVNKLSPANSTISLSSKVIATGSWTVTDASVPSVGGSNSSSSSVNSTTDWHVTSTNSESSIETIVNKVGSDNKKNGHIDSKESSKCSVPVLGNGISRSSIQSISCSNSLESGLNATSFSDDYDNSSISKTSNKKCDFQKQPQNEKPFLGSERNSKQHNSFLKRKCDDSDQKISEGSSKSLFNEDRGNSVPKKAKYTEEFIKSPSKNGLGVRDKSVNAYGKLSCESKNVSYSNKSIPNEERSPSKNKNGTTFYDKVSSKSEKSVSSRRTREADGASSSESSPSSFEYEWVEKTKDSMENTKERDKRNGYSGSNSYSKSDRSHDVVSELTRNSNYFYGAPVPTWKGENRYKDKSVNEKRKYLDDYEDEYDRGKVRKFKPRDRYQRYYKENPFQKYEERKYNHKYNGNFYYGHRSHHQKPYDSYYKWKQYHNHYHQQNRKHFKPHYRR
ncbi:Ubiquitin carboxyl-terminal hydrolase 42 like protein [Argiope bruennichi]|uniref:Ubiquitin carboxyl-terminal hydrolase 36 n=1 Tax=Argiope bruennichi TaxID=94029 RepID=A0A8T0EM53_ARGBR|nr:Ubiquitin carboxyl-terminal hydrolase 42 like protein [Argiope bruennichi]